MVRFHGETNEARFEEHDLHTEDRHSAEPKDTKKDQKRPGAHPEHTRSADAMVDRSVFGVFSPPEMCFARLRKIWSDPNLETQRPERTTEESSDPRKNRVAAVTEKTHFV